MLNPPDTCSLPIFELAFTCLYETNTYPKLVAIFGHCDSNTPTYFELSQFYFQSVGVDSARRCFFPESIERYVIWINESWNVGLTLVPVSLLFDKVLALLFFILIERQGVFSIIVIVKSLFSGVVFRSPTILDSQLASDRRVAAYRFGCIIICLIFSIA